MIFVESNSSCVLYSLSTNLVYVECFQNLFINLINDLRTVLKVNLLIVQSGEYVIASVVFEFAV